MYMQYIIENYTCNSPLVQPITSILAPLGHDSRFRLLLAGSAEMWYNWVQRVKEMDIRSIQQAAEQQHLFFTDHAVRQMAKRNIMDTEVQEAILGGVIIEEYPDDKYGPSCLIYGHTRQRRPLHVQCSEPPRIRVVTVYQPDPNEWVDNRFRRKP